MATKLPNSVINFATETKGSVAPYMAIVDYVRHYRSQENSAIKGFVTHDGSGKMISFDEKEANINKIFRDEVLRVAGIQETTMPFEVMVNNPSIKWAFFAVVSQVIDALLPETVIESTGMYADVRTIGYGDTAKFVLSPRDLFVVSKYGRGQRTAEVKKQYKGNVTINPEPRMISVGVSMYRVITGKESLAEFLMKAVRSIETEMTRDIYTAFATAMTALPTSAPALRLTGYTQAGFVGLGQLVQAANGGAKPVVMGTQLALANVIPANSNFRFMIDSDYVKLGYVRDFQGFETMVVPQVYDWNTGGLIIANDRLWFVSPGTQKIVKVVIEGATRSTTNSFEDTADLTQQATLYTSWGVGIVTNAFAGVITL